MSKADVRLSGMTDFVSMCLHGFPGALLHFTFYLLLLFLNLQAMNLLPSSLHMYFVNPIKLIDLYLDPFPTSK